MSDRLNLKPGWLDPPGDKTFEKRGFDLGEFGTREFVGAISDIRSALIDEAWFDRASASVTHIHEPSLGWDLPEEFHSEDPLHRTSRASDRNHRPPERDHPHELDFDH